MEISFNLIGREWKDRDGKKKYFNSLQAWKIELDNEGGESGNEDSDEDSPF